MDAFPEGLDLCQIPAQLPPPGHTSNFVDPVTLQPAVIGVGISTTALAIIFTAARIFTNWRKMHAADIFAAIGTFMITVYTIITIVLSKYDRHQWDTPACWFDGKYLRFLFVQLTIFGPSVFFAKTAIFLMYLQLFHVNRSLRIAVYVGIFITFGAYWTSVPVAAYFAAPRPGHSWESVLLSKRPARSGYWGVSQGAIAIFLDIYIFILPLPILWNLNMKKSRRLQLIMLFGTALIAIVASAVALNYRLKLLTRPDGTVNDTTWNQACTAIAVLIENNVAIIVGAMPTFAAFLRAHVAESSFFNSLRLRILSLGSGGSKGKSSGEFTARHHCQSNEHIVPQPNFHQPSFGPMPQERPFYELREDLYTNPRVAINASDGCHGYPAAAHLQNGGEQGEKGVWRSIEVVQESHPQSGSTQASYGRWL